MMLLGGISISAQYLENTIKIVPRSFKAPNVLQVSTSRKKKGISFHGPYIH